MSSEYWPNKTDDYWKAIRSGMSQYFKQATFPFMESVEEILPLVLCVALTCDSKSEHIIQITQLKGNEQSELMM
jgi:hypothetical protein